MSFTELLNEYIEFIYKGDYSNQKILNMAILCNKYSNSIRYGSVIETNILKTIYHSLENKYKVNK